MSVRFQKNEKVTRLFAFGMKWESFKTVLIRNP